MENRESLVRRYILPPKLSNVKRVGVKYSCKPGQVDIAKIIVEALLEVFSRDVGNSV